MDDQRRELVLELDNVTFRREDKEIIGGVSVCGGALGATGRERGWEEHPNGTLRCHHAPEFRVGAGPG